LYLFKDITTFVNGFRKKAKNGIIIYRMVYSMITRKETKSIIVVSFNNLDSKTIS